MLHFRGMKVVNELPKSSLRVSIITPTFNSAEFVADNIKSVLGQTYKNIEHVFIDGGSRDKTLSIIREMDPAAKVLSEPDKGISDAFNKGLRLATGDIIAVLNSDDYYADDRVIEKVVGYFRQEDIKLLYGKMRMINRENGELVFVYGKPFDMGKMLRGFIIPHQAVFVRKEVHEEVGDFSLDYKIAMDYDFFMRAVRVYKPRFVDEEFAVFRLGGLSSKHACLAQRENYIIKRKNGVGFFVCAVDFVYGYLTMMFSVVMQRLGLFGLLLKVRKLYGKF